MLFGYNGFPVGIADFDYRWERPTKYEYVIHAEENALLKAVHCAFPVDRATLYCTHKPCHKCMGKIIQIGIKTIIYQHKHDDSKITDELAREARIRLECLADYEIPF
jgi:dCMP deaminase